MIVKSARANLGLIALVLTVVLAACSNTPAQTPFPSRSADVVPGENEVVEPSMTPLPSDGTSPDGPVSSAITNPSIEPTDPDLLGDFTCEFPFTGGLEMISTIADVRVGSHDGYDRVVFEFTDVIPSFELAIVEPPLTEDGSGNEMEVAGDSFLRITMTGTSKADVEGEIVYDGPTEFDIDAPRLAELEEGGDFERHSTWYIGLNGDADPCLRVLEFSNPARLVIDIEH